MSKCKNLPICVCRRQMKPNYFAAFNNPRTNPQQFQPQGVEQGGCQSGPGKCAFSEMMQQNVSSAVQQKAKAICREAATRSQVRTQSVLMVLDPVFHLTASAIHFVVQIARILLRHIRYDKSDIHATFFGINTNYDPARFAPASRLILKLSECAVISKFFMRQLPPTAKCQPLQSAVGGQTQYVPGVFGLAYVTYFRSSVMRIPTDSNMLLTSESTSPKRFSIWRSRSTPPSLLTAPPSKSTDTFLLEILSKNSSVCVYSFMEAFGKNG